MSAQPECSTGPTTLAELDAAPAQDVVAMLLAGAEGFTSQAVVAIQQRDLPAKARLVNRVSAIIEQLLVMLNFEDGGEVVENLARIYEWWLKELFEASTVNAAERLERISVQMGHMKESWQH